MNNPCINCKKEIHYYAGFCHHCESKQPRKEPKYGEKKIHSLYNWWDGTPTKVEKMPGGIEIKREFNKSNSEINEYWTDEEGVDYVQTWNKHFLDLLGFVRTKDNITLNYYFPTDGYLYRKTEFTEEENITTEYYNLSIQTRSIQKYIGDTFPSRLTEAIFFTPDGSKIGQLADGDRLGKHLVLEYDEDGKLLQHPIVYVKHRDLIIDLHHDDSGHNKTKYDLIMSDPKGTYNIIDKEADKEAIEKENERQRKEDKSRTSYHHWLQLKDSFDPTTYDKKCTDCFETIKLPAKICHYCKRQFSETEVRDAIDKKFNELHPKP